jgi:hypothetical protein
VKTYYDRLIIDLDTIFEKWRIESLVPSWCPPRNERVLWFYQRQPPQSRRAYFYIMASCSAPSKQNDNTSLILKKPDDTLY